MPDAAFFARGRAVAESLMEDTCTISRDPLFVADSTLNTATGVLTAPSPATTTVYTGVCTVKPEERQQNETDEGGAPTIRRRYQAMLPVDAAEVAIGDRLTVTATTIDPLLVDEAFVVTAVARGTHVFRRVLSLDHVVRADAQ